LVAGIAQASGELTYHTNVVQMAPRDRLAEYAAAQSLLLGVRGSIAPFAASALLGAFSAHVVLVIGLLFMVAGTVVMFGAVREPAQRPRGLVEVSVA